MRIAAVDLGTNTLLMVVADVEAESMSVVCDMHRIVRLGEGLSATGSISPDAMERTCTVIHEYASLCSELQVDMRVGVATSAARKAANGTAVLRACSDVFGASILKISGEEEAALTYAGCVQGEANACVLDIGGGSTEIVSGDKGRIVSTVSMDIGAVMLHETYLRDHPAPASHIAEAEAAIRNALRDVAPTKGLWTGVAGTPTTLALMAQDRPFTDVEAAHDYVLRYDTVGILCENLLRSSLTDISSYNGVHPQRADILPAGALILREIMNHHGCSEIRVSTRGLRYGVLLRASRAVGRRV